MIMAQLAIDQMADGALGRAHHGDEAIKAEVAVQMDALDLDQPVQSRDQAGRGRGR